MILLHNARIRTNNQAQPLAQALLIDCGRIRAIGTDAEILPLADGQTRKENLQGAVLWPGLCDAHMHLELYARNLATIDCETPSRAEILRRVRAKAAETPQGAWIRGHGWNQTDWPEGFGQASDLDRVTPQHPVYLTAKSLHASWANASALRLAGIDRNTPDPVGGQILRDASGAPTGFLLESAADLVEAVLPHPTPAETADLIRAAQPALWKLGLTGLHNFDRINCFTALQILDECAELKLRVNQTLPVDHLPVISQAGLRSGFGSTQLRIGSIKAFADGALGPHTAAMLQPYLDEPSSSGMLLIDREQILEYGLLAAQTGLSLSVHAIGDSANHEVLAAYAQLHQAETAHNLPHLRHRVEHAQILHPDDLALFSSLNVIASMQPMHALSDMKMAQKAWGERCANAYTWNSLRQSGAHLALGSDAPVENPNPFHGLHAAVARRQPDAGPQDADWYPQERLSLEDALAGFTTGAAYAAGWENFLGKLKPGYAADLILLSEDPFQIPARDLHDLLPQATMFAGEWVWREG